MQTDGDVKGKKGPGNTSPSRYGNGEVGAD